MDWKTLFFGFDGRIGRKPWWLATILLLSGNIGLSMLVNPHAWFGRFEFAPPSSADMLLSLAFLIPETAVNVKRSNDRDWPQWIAYGYSLLVLAYLAFEHFRGMLGETVAPAGVALLGFLALCTLALIFDFGLLRGTRGPNRFGGDPLERPALGTGGNS